jgi:hypothetical protein
MNKLKELQEKYKKGELTKVQYLAAVAALVDSKDLTQDEADDATDYNPDADKPVYTQADVDGMIARKSTQALRKILKDAGVEIDAANKDLPGKVVELVKIGTGKMKVPEGQEVEQLKAQAAKAGTMAADVKTLRLENALLKTIGKYNPVSASPVIALLKSDYAHLVDYVDETTGEVDLKSVERVVKRLQLDEPTLFKADDQSGDKGGKGGEGNNFRGKGPGGTGSAGDKGHDTNKARALEMMGLNKKDETKK